MNKGSAKSKQKETCVKEKPLEEKRHLCKPLSLSGFTFDEIVETALETKPKKKQLNQGGVKEDPVE